MNGTARRVPVTASRRGLRVRRRIIDVQLGRACPAKFWDRSILAAAKPDDVVLPLAWNDPAGEWKLTFTDPFSPDARRTETVTVEQL
jgi:hypothetical protein